MVSMNVQAHLFPSNWEGSFEWLQPFHLLSMKEPPTDKEQMIEVSSDVILRFGLLEGDARVKGKRVIYDPQSEEPKAFWDNGSSAEELALILTPEELVRTVFPDSPDWSGDQIDRAIVELFQARRPGSLVVVLKDDDRLGGASLYLGEEGRRLPTYAANGFFRIGAGDVFASAFAYAWGERQLSPWDSADYAAKCVAYYLDGARLPLPPPEVIPTPKIGRELPSEVRLVGRDTAEIGALLLYTEGWLREHFACTPVLELFESRPAPGKKIPTLLLADSLTSLDTIMNLSEQAESDGPNVVYWPRYVSRSEREMSPRLRITDDYASALYQVLRGAIR
ncbi:hypothetical protein [Dongia sp.]|uniref:hypothetical protein n=1 Tax=Dongia sp. TaxID=1977262 RepID=UPI003751C8CE